MVECLKLLHELAVISQRLETPFLKHFYHSFDPISNKNLASAINHFHLRDLESADYRSAYHQLCDWFYGWNVTDATDYSLGASAVEHFRMKRVPRDILISEPGERVECERIIKMFETLFLLTRRALNRYYIDIEESMPKIGQGLGTISHSNNKDEDDGVDVDKEDIWKQTRDTAMSPGLENEEEDADDGSFENINRRISRVYDGLVVRRKNVDPTKQRTNDTSTANQDQIIEEEDGELVAIDGDDYGEGANSGKNTSKTGRDSPASSQSSASENDDKPATGTEVKSPGQTDVASKFSNMAGLPNQGFNFMQATKVQGTFKTANQEDAKLALQKDINHIYFEIDKCFDYTLIAISNVMLIMAFSELLDQKETFKKYISLAHELSGEFVSNILKTVWDLLNKELSDVTLQDLRNPMALKAKIREVMTLREVNGKVPQYKFRRLHKKFILADELFSAFDIHLFPNFVAAHKEAVRTCQFSTFDSSLWLSAGYDCAIRIHDLRESNNHICLSQYVGHKSIVTDAHFCKDDTHIVSSSFDRTVKIWNSQSAACEKTLLGHTDSVTSCDVTQDGRYIASGSIDMSVRIWDFNTGECLVIIKKHTRWVKVVRFSQDGRYLITAGLDNKIYVWDVKLTINSRNFAPSRCIEVHSDCVLDMATAKPSLLLTTSRDSTVRLFDYATGYEKLNVSLAPSWACTVAFSPEGEFFATGSFDNNVIIFNLKDGQRVREIRVLNLGISCVRFPRDLKYVTVGTVEGFLQQIPL